MKLKCHAILKSGEMCRASASSLVNGLPACGRLRHQFAEFMPLTEESISPLNLEDVRMAIEFLCGTSMGQLAIRHRKTCKEVQDMIRRAA